MENTHFSFDSFIDHSRVFIVIISLYSMLINLKFNLFFK